MLGFDTTGLFDKISNQLKVIVRGSYRDVLARTIPGFNILEQQVNNYLDKRQISVLNRSDEAVVDRGEIQAAFREIDSVVGASYNPFRIGLNIVRFLLGKSKTDRIQGEINILKDYARLNDNYIYANDAIGYLKKLLDSQISQKEGLISKLGFSTNKDVLKDPVINSVKAALSAWMTQPNESLLSGRVPNAALYQSDIDFFEDLVVYFSSGKRAKYAPDLASVATKILNEMKDGKAKKLASLRQNTTDQNRSLANNLASV